MEGKSYAFKVVIEPDEDGFHVYCPALEKLGGATWGSTETEALERMREVAQAIVEECLEASAPIPSEPERDVQVFNDARVSVVV